MTARTLLYIGIVLLVIVAIVILYNNYSQYQTSTNTGQLPAGGIYPSTSGGKAVGSGQNSAVSAPLAATVSFTGSGFSPSILTIKAGATVTFKNDSSINMWPASNPHPTHTDYPGFDAKMEIPPGGTYSFTFYNAGTWGYHDHPNPNIGGTIAVQP